MSDAENMAKFLKDFEELMEATSGSVRADSEFRKIPKWDSLKLVELVAMVDEAYGVSLDVDRLDSCKTVQEIFELVKG